MRVAFICGCLEPGKDGVGDYTRNLADELVRGGDTCLLISLSDHVNKEEVTKAGADVYRSKRALLSTEFVKSLKGLLREWRPDVISLQFVSFSFHPKGLIHQLIPFIEHLGHIAPMHLMLHELWLGEQPDLPIKHKLLGVLQRRQILTAIKRWQPCCIHTSNTLYQKILEDAGIQAIKLPIFGNIPIFPALSKPTKSRESIRKVVFPFSQRKDWNIDETLQQLRLLSDKAGCALEFIQVGHLRKDATHWNKIQDFCRKENWDCHILEARPEKELSKLLQSCDIGICAAHVALADKSGAAVAMLEHGLPIICTITQAVSKRFNIRSATNEQNIYSFFDDEQTLVQLIHNPPKRVPKSRLPNVAARWKEDIIQNQHG